MEFPSTDKGGIMGVDILESILSNLMGINEERERITSYFLDVLDFSTVFNCETVFQEKVGVDIAPVSKVVFSFAFYLLALKFVWKLFNTYMLGADGNEDAEPVIHVVNLGKAIFISLAFGLLFSDMMSIGNEIAIKILNAIKMKPIEMDSILDALYKTATVELGELLMLFVYIIMSIVLAVTFTLNAIQLIILRVGISFSALGMLDSDGGVFKPYIKKFFQICFAVIIQLVCYKLSMYALSQGSYLWAITLLLMALKAPAWLSEFIMTNPSGGGKLQQALYSISILRSFRRA